MIAFPGPWGFLPRSGIILVSDEELETLANDPDQKINMATTFTPRNESLRQVCERAQQAGQRTLIIAFDHFFRQYRPGQDQPRRLTPDMPEYIALMAKIGRFAQQFGLGLELSLLSPLEIGPAYERRQVKRARGCTIARDCAIRRPAPSVSNCGSKGDGLTTKVRSTCVRRACASLHFGNEDSPVRPIEWCHRSRSSTITDTAQVEVWEDTTTAVARRVRVYGTGRSEIGELNRVVVVQLYRTPEMDYFSDKALPYLKQLVDQYADAGIQLNGLYSDEMHIQQDWGYFQHHDHGEFALRYVSDGLARRFADRYGEQYRGFCQILDLFHARSRGFCA